MCFETGYVMGILALSVGICLYTLSLWKRIHRAEKAAELFWRASGKHTLN